MKAENLRAASPDDIIELKSDEDIILVDKRHRLFMSIQSVKSVNSNTVFENKRICSERVFETDVNENDNQ